MAIPDHHRHNFQTLRKAAENGDLALMECVEKATGAAANSDLRFYLLPGVYHCRGGPGADQFDSLAAIDAWVDQGKAPETLLATRADHKLSRPLCRYPALPHYKGGGDPRSAESFECRAPGDGG